MKVLLVEPSKSKSWGKNSQYIGLLKIGNYFKSTSNKVQYVVAPDKPAFYPDEIYISSMFTYWYDKVYEAVKFYRKLYPKSKILLGGIYATISPEHAKLSGADEVMVGQHPLAKDYSPDPMLLPYKQDFAYLFTSYGCNKCCTYCATRNIYGEGIKQLPVEKVIDDIKFLISKGFNQIWFGDDDILYNCENHINAICKEIISQQLKVKIHIPGGMVAKNLTQKTASLMKAAGVKEISFSIESISQVVRKRMGRENNTNEEDLIRALSFTDKARFKRSDIKVFFIIGLPYQTLDDMLDTLVFLLKLGVYSMPQRLTPIPHTAVWKQMGLESWDYLDLDYKKFVAPDQNSFTYEDLENIYKISWFFTIGQRYSNYSWLRIKNKINDLFYAKLSSCKDRQNIFISNNC